MGLLVQKAYYNPLTSTPYLNTITHYPLPPLPEYYNPLPSAYYTPYPVLSTQYIMMINSAVSNTLSINDTHKSGNGGRPVAGVRLEQSMDTEQ